MNCKKCGNKITNGTYCLRCGTENNEKGIDNDLSEIGNKKEPKKEKNPLVKIFLVWIVVFAIIALIYHIMDNSFKSCVEKNGSYNCGLGTLCDKKCMPPFYFTTSFIYYISVTITTVACPVMLLIIIFDKIVDKSDKKKIDSSE